MPSPGKTLTVMEDTSLDRLTARGISKVAVLFPPWILLVIAFGLGAAFHALWGTPPAVTWMGIGLTLCTVVLTSLTWLVSHARAALGRIHSTVTTGLAGLWMTVSTVTGATQSVVFGLFALFGLTLAVSWNIRAVIRSTGAGDGVVDQFGALFDKGKDSFGWGGARARTVAGNEHKVEAVIELPAGEKTVADLQKKILNVEGAMGMPPGALIVAEDENRADRAKVTITDPRVMKRPIVWPGPSMPAGASIADAIRLGLYQDADEALLEAVDFHLMVMGMSGSGKSFGFAYNLLAEGITRKDCAFWGLDITKADQTLGPVEAALDWVVYDEGGAVKMLRALDDIVSPRTAYLAEHGYQSWKKGCGLQYLIVLIEEAPDVFDILGQKALERLLGSLKAARSAGVFIVLSLQRADYTQLPTIARAQFGGKACFGVESASDAKFGLPDHVLDAGAAPERWASTQQGMCYLVAPGIPESKFATPVRTYLIDVATMRAHCEAHPATERPLDKVTAAAAGNSYADRTRTRAGFSVYRNAVKNTQVTGSTFVADLPQADDDEGPGPLAVDSDLLEQAAELVIAAQLASTAMLQRKLRLAFADTEAVMYALERCRVVSTPDQGGKRRVLVAADDAAEALKQVRDVGDPVGEHLRTEDPSPEITATGDEDIETAGDLRFPQDVIGGKLPPDMAREEFHRWLRSRAAGGKPQFVAADLLEPIKAITGYGRAWVYKVLDEAEELGAITVDQDGRTRRFTIINVDALGGLVDA